MKKKNQSKSLVGKTVIIRSEAAEITDPKFLGPMRVIGQAEDYLVIDHTKDFISDFTTAWREIKTSETVSIVWLPPVDIKVGRYITIIPYSLAKDTAAGMPGQGATLEEMAKDFETPDDWDPKPPAEKTPTGKAKVGVPLMSPPIPKYNSDPFVPTAPIPGQEGGGRCAGFA